MLHRSCRAPAALAALILFAFTGCADRHSTGDTASEADSRAGQRATAAAPQAPEPAERAETTPQPAPPPPPRYVRIGAWNIEWLGTPESRSGPAKGVAQKPEDLADYIEAADVAILGLAEIARTDNDDSWTNATLTAAFELLNQRTGARWRHRLWPAHSGRNQLCGIAWDQSRVKPVGQMTSPVQTVAPPGGGSPVWSRPAPAMMFSACDGCTDFVVVAIHMKSNYRGDFAEHRGKEAAALVAGLPRTFQDGDLLIIGDSNCNQHSEPACTTFQTAGWTDLNAGDTPTFWTDSALDRVFVPSAQPEFAERRFEVLRDKFLDAQRLSKRDFKRRFSDHYMIVTEVRVMPDDD